MIKRRKLIIALGAGALAVPFASFAQQQGKVWRIGFISTRSEIGAQEEAFRQGLRELAYVEGQNIVIEWRFSKGKAELHPEFASELVKLKMDCIVTGGISATLAAKQASNTIPIVMANSDVDPVRSGAVASLARPGGNVTGFTNIGSDLAGKRLELLREIVPKASRLAIVWDPDSRASGAHIRATRAAARTLGVHLQSLEVWDADDIENAFRAAVKERLQALIVVATGLINSHHGRIANLAANARLPTIYTGSQGVFAGGLMSYGVNGPDQYHRAAGYVDRIIKGAKPADLPVVQPTRFELIINLKAAKQIGLTISPNMLVRADKVIE